MISLQSLQTFFTRLSRREKTTLYATAAFVFILLIDKLLISPSFSRIKSQEEEIQTKIKIINKDLHILNLKDRIQEESKKYEGYFSKSESLEEEITASLKELENLANKAGVYLAYIRPGNVTADESFENYFINLNCEAEMPQVVSFLYSIEDSKRLLSIDKYVISPKSDGSSIAQCRLTVSKETIR